MNETDLTRAIRDLLIEESAGMAIPADLAARARNTHHRRRRRMLTAAVPMVAAGAAVAVVLAAGTHGGSPTRPVVNPQPAPGTATGHPVATERARYVIRRVKASIANDGGQYIQETTQRSPASTGIGPMRSWLDSRPFGDWSIQYDRSGHPQYAQGQSHFVIKDNHQYQTDTSVDYAHHTWTRWTATYGPLPPQSIRKVRPRFPYGPGSAIKRALDRGHLKIIGRGTVDGSAALKLDIGPTRAGSSTLWVYLDTYHPAKYDAGALDTITWLPRTPATLALTTPPIPPGFRRVAQAPNS